MYSALTLVVAKRNNFYILDIPFYDIGDSVFIILQSFLQKIFFSNAKFYSYKDN